jgi:hypothetical protein
VETALVTRMVIIGTTRLRTCIDIEKKIEKSWDNLWLFQFFVVYLHYNKQKEIYYDCKQY